MHVLEKLEGESNSGVTSETSTENADVQVKVAIVDTIAEVQLLDKPDWIKTLKDLAEHFSNRLFSKYDDTQEIRLIFDRYDVQSSLKKKQHRPENKDPKTLFIIALPIRHIVAKCP